MVIRRTTDPINIQNVWNTVRYIQSLRQTNDLPRIVKYLQKDGYTANAAELHVKQAIKDGLIVAFQKKSSLPGLENTIYKIPTIEEPELDGKDWYCFECHLAGDVTPCRQCFRVFHNNCIPSARSKYDTHIRNNYNKISNKKTTNITKETENISENTINILSDSDEGVKNSEGDQENSDVIESEASTSKVTSSKKNTIDSFSRTYDETLCGICNIAETDDDLNLEVSEINYLLKFVLHRIRAWLPSVITHTMAQEEKAEWTTDSELTWRANQLFFEHKDMSVIEVNINTNSYKKLSQFQADVLTVQHNVAIFHGSDSQEYGAAELMVRDCLHDLTELKHCADCYKHSNEKINAKWFCLPCRVPHELVWAKQKGYPYWPAKLIRETDSHFDVRFFGGKYERALLLKSYIKPITVKKETLQIKTSAAFNKAMEELKYHQKLFNDPKELEKLKTLSKQKRNSISKQKSFLSKQGSSSKNNNSTNNSIDNDSAVSLSPVKSTGKKRNSKRKSTPITKKGTTRSYKRRSLPAGNDKPSTSNNNKNNENVIDISDGDDDDQEAEYSYRESFSMGNLDCDSAFEQVSSSTENYRQVESTMSDNSMQQLDQPYSDSVEKMRRKLLNLTEKREITKCAMDCMQKEIDKITNDHNEHLKRLFESHNAQISETKKKQWCYNCEQDAIYHCCWNTAYCSQTCQQQHWQSEHKKVCRRKR